METSLIQLLSHGLMFFSINNDLLHPISCVFCLFHPLLFHFLCLTKGCHLHLTSSRYHHWTLKRNDQKNSTLDSNRTIHSLLSTVLVISPIHSLGHTSVPGSHQPPFHTPSVTTPPCNHTLSSPPKLNSLRQLVFTQTIFLYTPDLSPREPSL